MTGLLTPDPIPGVSSLPVLFGLHVVLGHQDKRGRWVREPTATYTCPHGCTYAATGPDDVTQLVKGVREHHARHCPARTAKKDTA